MVPVNHVQGSWRSRDKQDELSSASREQAGNVVLVHWEFIGTKIKEAYNGWDTDIAVRI
jgi:hypothetical protein